MIKKYIKRERVEIPYELKDESLGGDSDENWPQFDAVTLWAEIKG